MRAKRPIQLQDELPLLPIPLLEPDPDVPLNLATAVSSVYERGSYDSIIDYSQSPPPPPLTGNEIEYMQNLLT